MSEFIDQLRRLAATWEHKADRFTGLSREKDDAYACYASMYRSAQWDLLAIVDPASDRETPATRAPQATGATTEGGREGEVGGEAHEEAHEAAAGRTGLRDAIAEALYQWTLKAAGARRLIPPDEASLRENARARADAVMKAVGPAIERVHQMTDACDELLVRERSAHAKTTKRADAFEAAMERVRELITCDPVEDHHDHVCPDTVLVTDVLAALGLAVLVAKPTEEGQ